MDGRDDQGREEFLMPWNTAVTLLLGGAQNVIIDYDTTAFVDPINTYNVFDILGGPADPVVLTINISAGADLGTLEIDNRFNASSSFIINCTDGARAVGKGGSGGRGGEYETEPGGPTFNRGANDGLAGGAAIISAFDFSLDTDDGFILGGGGGGGGGAAITAGSNNQGGSGGGGQGWNDAAGASTGGPASSDGTDGSLGANGLGGLATSGGGNGGDGGPWGNAGVTGGSATGGSAGTGGAIGFAILAVVSSITVTLSGAKSQGTLESESRLVGGTSGVTYA